MNVNEAAAFSSVVTGNQHECYEDDLKVPNYDWPGFQLAWLHDDANYLMNNKNWKLGGQIHNYSQESDLTLGDNCDQRFFPACKDSSFMVRNIDQLHQKSIEETCMREPRNFNSFLFDGRWIEAEPYNQFQQDKEIAQQSPLNLNNRFFGQNSQTVNENVFYPTYENFNWENSKSSSHVYSDIVEPYDMSAKGFVNPQFSEYGESCGLRDVSERKEELNPSSVPGRYSCFDYQSDMATSETSKESHSLETATPPWPMNEGQSFVEYSAEEFLENPQLLENLNFSQLLGVCDSVDRYLDKKPVLNSNEAAAVCPKVKSFPENFQPVSIINESGKNLVLNSYEAAGVCPKVERFPEHFQPVLRNGEACRKAKQQDLHAGNKCIGQQLPYSFNTVHSQKYVTVQINADQGLSTQGLSFGNNRSTVTYISEDPLPPVLKVRKVPKGSKIELLHRTTGKATGNGPIVDLMGRERMFKNPPVVGRKSLQNAKKVEQNNKEYKYACSSCGEKFALKRLLVSHVRGHKKLNCKICSAVVSSKRHLKIHMKKEHTMLCSQGHSASNNKDAPLVTSKFGRTRRVKPASMLLAKRSRRDVKK